MLREGLQDGVLTAGCFGNGELDFRMFVIYNCRCSPRPPQYGPGSLSAHKDAPFLPQSLDEEGWVVTSGRRTVAE